MVVLEKLFHGGQISVTNEVENYPAIDRISGPDLANRIYEQAAALGADVRYEDVSEVDLAGPVKRVTTSGGEYEARAVIIANGVQRRKLQCPGEEKFLGRGVSYCATCDGAFFKGKDTAVVGGGNTALEDALFLANLVPDGVSRAPSGQLPGRKGAGGGRRAKAEHPAAVQQDGWKASTAANRWRGRRCWTP